MPSTIALVGGVKGGGHRNDPILSMRSSVKLAEALSHYISTLSSNPNDHANRDLHRFGRWIGWERSVIELAPPEVAQYAEEVVKAGGDVHGHLTPIKEFLAFLKRKGMLAHSLAPHLKIPRASRLAAASFQARAESIPMTPSGHEALTVELRELKGLRVHVAEEIRAAAADKDFKENAPLDAARDKQGKMEARIRELEELLRRAVVIERTDDARSGEAQVGSLVVLKDLSSGKEIRYMLVDSAESDPLRGKISVASPVGKAVVGCSQGDAVEVKVPKGVKSYKVVSVAR
jgi:transcription elongation factor GreA